MAYISNACRCRLSPDDGAKINNAAVKHCKRFLDRAIEIAEPRVIVSLGAVALRTLTGQQKILSNRGRIFKSETGIPIVCTVHPAYVLRGAQRGFPNIEKHKMQQKERMIFEDFELVREILDRTARRNGETRSLLYDGAPETDHDPVNYSRDIDTAGYKECKAADLKPFLKAKYVSLDFECNSLNPFEPNSKLLSVALCKEGGKAITLFPKNGKFPADFKKIMENPKIGKIVANRGFEEKWMRVKLGIKMKGPVHDVLVLAHLIDENGSGYDLETLAGIYTPLKKIKDVIGGKSEIGKKISEADKETLVAYNAVDADATFRLFHALKKHLETDPKLVKYYARFILPTQNMFADCFMNGVKVDTTELAKAEQWFSKQMDKYYAEAIKAMPLAVRQKHEGRLELKRRHLIIDTVFKEIGYGYKAHPDYKTPKTGEPKVSKEHLNLLLASGKVKKKAKEFIAAYLGYVSAAKFRSTYLTAMWGQLKPDGKVYPDTILNRTVTGRTIMKDPPIQVIPSRGEMAKKIKRIFTADKGWYMIGRDLGQSEIRIAGWLAKDPNILGALRDNIDIHTKTASIVSRKPVEEVTEEERFQAKAINFGFLYGMGAPSFRQYAKTTYGIDLTEVEALSARRAFFSKPGGYWRLPAFHSFQRAFVNRHGFVRSPIGRKRNLPDVYSNDFRFKSGAERQAINMPIQSFSNDLGLIGMFLFHQACQADPDLKDNVRVAWFIHDAVYAFVKKRYWKRAMKLLKECMEDRAVEYIEQHFGIKVQYPVTSDGHYGPNWADQTKVK
jgi:DNA polymerase-1